MPTLKQLRAKAELSQGELARLSGLRQATVSALERGLTRPRQATVASLAVALDLSEEKIRASLKEANPTTATDGIAQMSSDWPFLAKLDRDLRSGLASSLVAEWTHSSTALEGNTISLGDTLFVLTEGLTISGKNLREHQEIHGHGQAVGLMAGWCRRHDAITISQLHDLHRAVQTGAAVDYLAPIGQWKVEDNGTMALTGSGKTKWHDYASPRSVSALIQDWLELFPSKKKTALFDDEELIEIYTDLHLGFVAIHPYADGNGRMARLVSNIPLLRAGRPPLLIEASQRRTYLALLGEYSISRGQPTPGESLVFENKKREAVREFFASSWKKSLQLVEEFHDRQRRRRGAL